MILDRVTVTGADDSTPHDSLLSLSQEFPFVEWGILMSKSNEGGYRFPSRAWLNGLVSYKGRLRLSAHMCGAWVRRLCKGYDDFFVDNIDITSVFDRIQLNFHAITHTIEHGSFAGILNHQPQQFIFQVDGVNEILGLMRGTFGVNAVPLFDKSGGIGVLPAYWPAPIADYCGYAGGLSPSNVEQQLELISKVVPVDQRIWIDVETRVRTPDDSVLDLGLVQEFLKNTASWVNKTL
jgi:hypothetical protein